MAALNLDKLGNTCACCAFATVVGLIAALFVVTKLFLFAFGGGAKAEASGVKKYFLLLAKWVSRITFVLIALVAIFLGVLQQQPELRSRFFATLLTKMAKSGHLHEERCGLVANLSGDVLEFGPGPGTNFKCMSGLPIDSWTGVEPNTYFAAEITANKAEYNLTFPTKTVWLSGGDVSIEAGTFDHVFATHVLCSVQDIESVLKQADRALKPGGTFHFMEHVAAAPGTSIRYMQYFISPFFYIVGNGCEFKESWTDVLNSESIKGYNITLKHFDADMVAPMIPHFIGTAVKPL
jgi:SAM-dependent methyltransferase